MMDPGRSTSRSTINVTIPSQHSGSVIGSADGRRQSKKHQFIIHQQDEQLTRLLATRAIERCWCSYRDRQMFKLLKHAVCAGEHSMTYEILRKVTPNEANLLKDKSMKARVRFRFAGSEFPPIILFKIFTHTEGQGLKYLSGKKIIKPASDAAADACKEMGHRKFYNQMLADTCQHQRDRITDEVDVTTVKDYMQYLSNLDELPAYMGGRENLWRKLDLNVLPRTTILYDIIDYLTHGRASDRLRPEIPVLTTKPLTQEMQLKHIKLISKLRAPLVSPAPTPGPASARGPPSTTPGVSSRRSRQARQRAAQMKRHYMSPTDDSMIAPQDALATPRRLGEPQSNHGQPPYSVQDNQRQNFAGMGDGLGGGMINDEEEEWEDEADKLYAWTQNLSVDDIGLNTPS